MKKKWIIFLLPFLIIIWLNATLKIFILPLVTNYANNQLKEISKSNELAHFSFDAIDFNILDPRINIKNIKISAKDKIKEITQGFEINEVTLKLDVFQILLGKLNFTLMSIDQLNLEFNIDPILESRSNDKEFNVDQLYSVLNLVPIQRFKIDNIRAKLNSKKNNITYIVNESNLRTSYLDSKFVVRLMISNSVVVNQKNSKQIPIELKTNLLLSGQSLLAREIFLKSNSSQINIESFFDNLTHIKNAPSGRISIATEINLDELHQNIKDFNFFSKLSSFKGGLKLNGSLNFKSFHDVSGNLDFNSENISYGKFDFGTARIRAFFKDDRVSFSEIEILHPAGKISIKKSSMMIKSPYSYHAFIRSSEFDLQKLFKSLNLNEIPVYTTISPDLDCEGTLVPFSNSCKGSAESPSFKILVQPKLNAHRIVEIGNSKIEGEFSVDQNKVLYKGNLYIGDSSAASEGVIDFEKGFEIKFQSNNASFRNIVSLSELDFKGDLILDGITKGDSHTATLEMNIKASQFSLEKYYFESLKSNLIYAKGVLSLSALDGSIGQSVYNGNLDIDLLNSNIKGIINFPKSYLQDLLKISEKIVPVPFLIEGVGETIVKLEGPLDFWKLNCWVNSHFSKVKIHTEEFSKLNLNIEGTNGNLNFKDTYLQKSKSRIDISGLIKNDKNFEIFGKGHNFKLEESEFVKSLQVPIFGDFNFTMTTTGLVTDPVFESKIDVKSTVIGDRQFESSKLNLQLTRSNMIWKNELFGDQVDFVLNWPFDFSNQKFLISGQVNNFDFTSLFAFIGAGSVQSDFSGLINGSFNFNSQSGFTQDLDGQILLKNFSINRGTEGFGLVEPGTINAKKGQLSLTELKLVGGDNTIEISGDDFTLDKLDVRVAAKSDLRLFHFLAPFLEEMSGDFELGTRISGPIQKPRILGQAILKDNFIKIKNFVHPFERINGTLVFSQSKILVQGLNSAFANGKLVADGQIEFVSPQVVPISLNIKATDINLNVPEKIRTIGNASLLLSGKWFPYLLSGNYTVSGGVFEKELSSDESQTLQSKQSIYLPKSIKEISQDPLNLDINVFLSKKYPIKNSLVDGSITGNIQIKGPVTSSIVLGKIEVEKGSILFFKDKKFELQNGLVNFTSQDQINPDLYITASSRVNDYDINLLLQGPAKTTAIKMSSSPPLAENEIISLLALGVTSAQLEQSVQSKDQAAQTASEIGAAVLSQSAITKNLGNKLGLDIQFVNQFDATKNSSVLKATASKRVTDKVQATASRSLGSQAATEVKVQYFINKNISAVGNWEGRELEADQSKENKSQSIFGLDLEFKREFK